MKRSLTIWTLLRKLLPKTERRSLRCLEILSSGFGHTRSMRESSCLDAQGSVIPWYTYPAIEYLDQFDWSESRVFEFGSGNSTLFWGQRAQHVTCVESDLLWCAHTRERIGSLPIHIHLITERERYAEMIDACHGPFDVIVVDGIHRGLCAKRAIPWLRAGGILVLDNSDWYPQTCELLRQADLIQVDMSGFGPINDYTWTTSLFLHREFRGKSRQARQPIPGIGSLDHLADDDCWELPRPAQRAA